MPFTLRFSNDVDRHLEHLSARQRATALDVIERQLRHQPTLETRNRKRMREGREGFIAPWELRIGDLRVYYDVQAGPEGGLVVVQAIGVKRRDRLIIGGREMKS